MQINERSAQGPGRRCQRTVLSLGWLTKKGGSKTKDLRPDLLDEFIRYNKIVGTTLPNARTTIRGHHTCYGPGTKQQKVQRVGTVLWGG